MFCSLQAKAVNVDIENGVYSLDDKTFDTVVKKLPAVMVYFFSPGCSGCKDLTTVYEKVAKKLRKAAEASGSSGGARLAKVDGAEQAALAQRYGVADFPALVVFKDGALFGTYTSGRDKDDLLGYMGAMVAQPPLDLLGRWYYISRSVYKDFLRLFLPGHVRKYLFRIYPAVLAFPLVFLLFCKVCCKRKPRSEKAANSKATDSKDSNSVVNGKRGRRMESPARTAKQAGDSEEETEPAEPKDAEEKKDD